MLMNWLDKVIVDVVVNGLEGVKMAFWNDYDIILMDFEMFVLNGIQAIIKIRSQFKIFIIVLIVNEFKQEQEWCQLIGINDYVVKLVKLEGFFKRVLQQVIF